MKANLSPSDWTEVRQTDPSDILIAELMSAKKLNPEARSKASSLHSAVSSAAKRAIASAAGSILQRANTRSKSSASAAASAFGLSVAPSILRSDKVGAQSTAGSESVVSKGWEFMSLTDAQLGRLESPRGFEPDESNPDICSKAMRDLAER